eukprot:6178627-Pleurochrysis_carterae.AAC.3
MHHLKQPRFLEARSRVCVIASVCSLLFSAGAASMGCSFGSAATLRPGWGARTRARSSRRAGRCAWRGARGAATKSTCLGEKLELPSSGNTFQVEFADKTVRSKNPDITCFATCKIHSVQSDGQIRPARSVRVLRAVGARRRARLRCAARAQARAQASLTRPVSAAVRGSEESCRPWSALDARS